MSYQRQSGKFPGWDGTPLFYQCWLADDPARGRNLIIHHGIGEHSGRYQPVVDTFSGEQVNIFALDARGHGRSPGKRGDSRALADFVPDLECFFEFLKSEFQVRQPVLLGHSMGGIVAIGFTLRFSNQWHLRSLVTSGAGLRPSLDFTQKIKATVGRLLRPLAPSLTVPIGLPLTLLSHDKQVIQSYDKDPLNHGMVSLQMGVGLMDAGEDLIRQADRVKIPVLVMHGEEDQIASMTGSIDFHEACSSPEKELRLYPGLFHEIFNETPAERQRVLADLHRWVLAHLPEVAPRETAATGASTVDAT
ncbi:MAG: alpha/beta hydrolase [Leptospirales bacterium]|jgi:alpha-beta hydrolase superfamily lysophospholipase